MGRKEPSERGLGVRVIQRVKLPVGAADKGCLCEDSQLCIASPCVSWDVSMSSRKLLSNSLFCPCFQCPLPFVSGKRTKRIVTGQKPRLIRAACSFRSPRGTLFHFALACLRTVNIQFPCGNRFVSQTTKVLETVPVKLFAFCLEVLLREQHCAQ